MTEYTHLVEERRLKLSQEREAWYIHINNPGGYTEVFKNGVLTTTYHDKRKKPLIETVVEV